MEGGCESAFSKALSFVEDRKRAFIKDEVIPKERIPTKIIVATSFKEPSDGINRPIGSADSPPRG